MNSRSAASIAARLTAAVALGTTIVLGASGCTFLTHQATTIEYPASDGVNVDATGGPVVVRNALIIATDDGSAGNLVAAFVNEGDETASVSIDVEGRRFTVRVPAKDAVSLGADEDPLLIEGLGVEPGATVEMLFRSGGEEADPVSVPVLDASLPSYADLAPDAE
ncbi:DNA modification methylase [Microbacterium soli]|uniref:DNA modification methylase n=1 Tax=Microbacterium soli TaxID=446075 RepID=A0ABP7NBE2_9MICO